MSVKLRTVGNSKTLTVPKDIKTLGNEYDVKNVGQTIVFTPVKKHVNIFSTPEWKNYDYQHDVKKDPLLQEVKPVGKEISNDFSK
ncbi:hypothetical protein FP435_03845 [Lactobacillus sp. PV037]|uniref:AbrB/MazE/SpoVT family DNA-binding domain-containing protein n=1 Tax=unclassified Lactobacillus TaxID=2620435 RepID=UPI0022408D1F|nr:MULTISPECIES: hypothetical protein [unclassified Lactobacillus]QNQ82254.1 hypothetical protein FP433_03985 [Lactobacillus sp. PV012]QNQ83635.1 hypothetical protein FP435_03845 [Lactobacillus sp. PV037]